MRHAHAVTADLNSRADGSQKQSCVCARVCYWMCEKERQNKWVCSFQLKSLMSTGEKENMVHSFSLHTTYGKRWKALSVKPAFLNFPLRKPQFWNTHTVHYKYYYCYYYVWSCTFTTADTYFDSGATVTYSTSHNYWTDRENNKTNTHWGIVFKVTISTRQGSTNTSQKQGANKNNHHFTPIVLPVVLCKTTVLSLRDVTVGAKVRTKSILLTKYYVNMLLVSAGAGIFVKMGSFRRSWNMAG